MERLAPTLDRMLQDGGGCFLTVAFESVFRNREFAFTLGNVSPVVTLGWSQGGLSNADHLAPLGRFPHPKAGVNLTGAFWFVFF